MMLSHVQIVCFASSYCIALLLEISRLFFRAPVRLAVTITVTTLGLFLHTVYLVMRSSADSQLAPPLSSWYDWLLLLAWGVAMVYLVTALRRPGAALGIFMLPLVLLLLGVASVFRGVPPFPRDQAMQAWGLIHGASLLLGSIAVMLGLVAGVMYLVQSYRLKHKLPPRQGLRLPSLEWLQHANKNTLLVSSGLLAAGLLSGVVLNLSKGRAGMPWSDPVVWTSGLLTIWLALVIVFELFYKPAQHGRKVAYLTMASFVFLGLVLGIVLCVPSQHAASSADPPGTALHGEAAGVGDGR